MNSHSFQRLEQVTINRRNLQVQMDKILHTNADLSNPKDLRVLYDLQKEDYNYNSFKERQNQRAFAELKFFQSKRAQLEENIYHVLFGQLRYQKFEGDQVVCHYGDPGDVFYIVLHGSVKILLPKPQTIHAMENNIYTTQVDWIFILKQDLTKKVTSLKTQFYQKVFQYVNKNIKPDDEAMFPQIKKILHKDQGKKFLKFRINHTSCVNSDDEGVESSDDSLDPFDEELEELFFQNLLDYAFPDFFVIKKLQQGDSFGEIALLTRQNRTASVICCEDTDFVTLSKQSFDQILGQEETELMNQKLIFFKKFAFFNPIPDAKLISLVQLMHSIQPQMNELIYKESESADFVYFVFKGEVEISKLIENNSKEPTQFEKQLATLKVVSKRTKRIQVSLIQEGSMFGQEEVLDNQFRKSKAINKQHNSQIFQLKALTFLSTLKAYSVEAQCKNFTQVICKNRDNRVTNQKINIDQNVQSFIQNKEHRELSREFDQFNHSNQIIDIQIMSDRKIEILKRLQSSKSNITKIKTESEQKEFNYRSPFNQNQFSIVENLTNYHSVTTSIPQFYFEKNSPLSKILKKSTVSENLTSFQSTTRQGHRKGSNNSQISRFLDKKNYKNSLLSQQQWDNVDQNVKLNDLVQKRNNYLCQYAFPEGSVENNTMIKAHSERPIKSKLINKILSKSPQKELNIHLQHRQNKKISNISKLLSHIHRMNQISTENK